MRADIQHEVSHDAKNTPIFTTFSAHTKMAADKRGQDEVFARSCTLVVAVVWCNVVVGAGVFVDVVEVVVGAVVVAMVVVV